MTQTFCSEYVLLSSGTEVPPVFTAWCGLSGISASLGRRVWIDMGPFNIYPNLFITLVAGSGRERKSTAMGVMNKILSQIDTSSINFLSEKSTTEALLSDLISFPNNKGQGYLIADEFTRFVNKRSSEGGIDSLLTSLYDCHDKVTASTKSRGVEKATNTQLGFLSGTTPRALRESVPIGAIGSGLTSRILFVYEDGNVTPIAFPQYNERQIQAQEFCINALKRFQQLTGKITLTPELKKEAETCYVKRCFTSPLFNDPYLSGYASRKFVHIMKVSIALCVGLTETLNITPQIFLKAEDLVNSLEPSLVRVMRLISTSDKGQEVAFVHSLVDKAGRITRTQLLALTSHRIDSRELTEIIDTLIHSGQIAVEHNGQNIFYFSRKEEK